MREKRENVLLVKKFWNKVLVFFSPCGLSLNNRNVWPVVATPILTFPSQKERKFRQWAATQQTNTFVRRCFVLRPQLLIFSQIYFFF